MFCGKFKSQEEDAQQAYENLQREYTRIRMEQKKAEPRFLSLTASCLAEGKQYDDWEIFEKEYYLMLNELKEKKFFEVK